jgi:hypothetical protein
MSIMKTGSASTLDIIKPACANKLDSIKGQLPPQLKITPLSDQSIFVRGAIDGVVREAIIAACLTAIMILVFLGSWRSTVIIAVSIPLSILCSLSVLAMLHETINIMTLGGLALAVGILVDDATVAIENINRNLEPARSWSNPSSTARRRSPSRPWSPPRHLHRLRAHVLPERRGALPVRAHGRGGGLRHAGQLPALAHAGPHHGQVPAQGARRRRRQGSALQPQPLRPLSSRASSPALSAFATAICACSTLCVDHAGGLSRSSSWSLPSARWGCCALARPGLLPLGGLRPVQDSRARPHRHAHRGDGALCDHIDSTIREQIPAKEVVTIVDNIGLPYSG